MRDPLKHRLGVAAKRLLLPLRLSVALRSPGRIMVVQIGSNDGRSGDPIHHLLIRNKRWSALFVEPVPYLFDRLRKNYPHESRFRFANVAIGKTTGALPFYFVDPSVRERYPELPEWVEQLGSFNRDYVAKHFSAQIDNSIITTSVRTVRLSEVLRQHEIEQFDFLHIDTEGYDLEVLRQVDFCWHRPRVILFEHKHLSPGDRASAVRLVQDAGYRLERWGGDYLCVLRHSRAKHAPGRALVGSEEG